MTQSDDWHVPEVGERYDNRWGSCFTVERVELEQGCAVCRWDTGADAHFRLSLLSLNGDLFIRLPRA